MREVSKSLLMDKASGRLASKASVTGICAPKRLEWFWFSAGMLGGPDLSYLLARLQRSHDYHPGKIFTGRKNVYLN